MREPEAEVRLAEFGVGLCRHLEIGARFRHVTIGKTDEPAQRSHLRIVRSNRRGGISVAFRIVSVTGAKKYPRTVHERAQLAWILLQRAIEIAARRVEIETRLLCFTGDDERSG